MTGSEMNHHATISRSGEIDFPLWVKALAWVIGLCIPIGFAAMLWTGNLMWAMNDRMTRMETKLEAAASDRYPATEARAQNELLQLQIDRNTENVELLQDRLGMRAQSNRLREPSLD